MSQSSRINHEKDPSFNSDLEGSTGWRTTKLMPLLIILFSLSAAASPCKMAYWMRELTYEGTNTRFLGTYYFEANELQPLPCR